MKIAVWSDLHLEFSQLEQITNQHNADVLLLAGDITVAHALHLHPREKIQAFQGPEYGPVQQVAVNTRDFFDQVSQLYDQVLYCPGNHEFYNGFFYKSIDHLRAECQSWPNLHFMENAVFEHQGVVFVGATLWTDLDRMNPVTEYNVGRIMSDYTRIRNDRRNYSKIRPIDTAMRHTETVEFIRNELAAARTLGKPVVMMTHHAPCSLSVAPCFKDNGDQINGAYYSDLSELILDNEHIALWAHGHMHSKSDYVIGSTRVICNPRGYHDDYQSQHTGWDQHLVIEI